MPAPNLKCRKHGNSPGSIVCIHIQAHGGEYYGAPTDGEGYPDLFCLECAETVGKAIAHNLPTPHHLLTTACMHCMRENILPKLTKCIGGQPVK